MSSLSSFTLSPGPTESPSLATWPLIVMWPWAMRISMLRREPWPDCAITFCRRSRLLAPPPPAAPPLPRRKRLLGLPWGRAQSGTTPPGHSSLCWGEAFGGLSLMMFGLRYRLPRFQRGLQLCERGQLLERAQVEVVEELARRGEERGTAGRFPLPHDFHPAALLERLERRRRNRDATDFLDVAARDRLAVRDDREGLEHRARVARRLLVRDAVEESLVVGLHAEAPARGDARELDRA